MYIVWDWLTSERYPIKNEIFANKSFKLSEYNYWFHNAIKVHDWAASYIVPAGSLFVLALLVLLMVLFKRCPLLITAVVAAILAVIIVFTIFVTLSSSPVYE